jgi:hypothetical protein
MISRLDPSFEHMMIHCGGDLNLTARLFTDVSIVDKGMVDTGQHNYGRSVCECSQDFWIGESCLEYRNCG